jgi:hypothetical protein
MTKTLEKRTFNLKCTIENAKHMHAMQKTWEQSSFEVKISIFLTFFFFACKMKMAKSIQSLFFPQKLLQKKKEAHIGVGSEENKIIP